MKPSLARWHLWDAMQAANALFQERAAGDPRIVYIDIATPMLTETGEPSPGIFVPDNLHMNGAGYDLWRDAVRPVLALEAQLEE